ncbi:MAG: hypothetical protein ABL921_34955 [Pirellula sp.]
MRNKPIAMVFDVESIGLHGQSFAVAYIVISKEGKALEEAVFACSPDIAIGSAQDREWCRANIPPLEKTHSSLPEMRDSFWARWIFWKQEGAVLVAEVAWPVEARFLAACVDDDPESRRWEGPHPLVDLTSLQLLEHGPPLNNRPRLPEHLPEHHPLADARHSVALWNQY